MTHNMGFDENQLTRSKKIADIWANLLYADLGYSQPPRTRVIKLGLQKYRPEISWETVFSIAKQVYDKNDRTYQAFYHATQGYGNENGVR